MGMGAGCTHRRWQHGHQGNVHHKGVHLLQRPAPVSSRCVHSSAKQSTRRHTDRPAAPTQHSAHSGPHNSRRRDLAVQMFNHVPSRKLFIKRDYKRFHLTSKTFSIVQRCPLRSTSGMQQSGFKLQIHPLPKGGCSVQ